MSNRKPLPSCDQPNMEHDFASMSEKASICWFHKWNCHVVIFSETNIYLCLVSPVSNHIKPHLQKPGIHIIKLITHWQLNKFDRFHSTLDLLRHHHHHLYLLQWTRWPTLRSKESRENSGFSSVDWSFFKFFFLFSSLLQIIHREVVKSKEIAESGVQLELVSLHIFCTSVIDICMNFQPLLPATEYWCKHYSIYI